MPLRLALLLLSAQAVATPRTDEVVQATQADPALATLYLRADGALDPNARDAIAGAVALLARVPGATLDILVEPRDGSSASLASALASLSTSSARVAMLARLVERNAPRWAQADVVERAAGLPPTLAPTRGRLSLQRPRPAANALPFLGRPAGVRAPGRAELVVAGVVAPSLSQLAALAIDDTPPRTAKVTPHAPSGITGHRLVLPWRGPRDACGPLELLGRLETEGRLRIELAAEVDPAGKPGTQAVARAMRRATPAAQVTLARIACGHALRTREDAAWVLSAAGIDPMTPGFLDGPVPSSLPPSPGPLLDGAPTTFLDALSLQKPPSLRRRLGTVDPRR